MRPGTTAVLPDHGERLAFTTDACAVRPLFFPGGDIGRHGSTIMAARGEVAFAEPLESDCAPLSPAVGAMLDAGIVPHCMRDLTRGGLGTALVELAATSGTTVEIDEGAIPVDPRVADACELFGLDPLYVANEGRFVAVVDPEDAEAAIGVLRTIPTTSGVSKAGIVGDSPGESGMLFMKTRYGTTRVIDMPDGEQLPRIC